MRRRFKSKKSYKNVLKVLVISILLFVFYIFMSRLVMKVHLGINDETLIYYVLEDANSHLRGKNKKEFNIDFFLKTLYRVDITKPVTFLQNTSHYIGDKNDIVLVYNENVKENVIPSIKDVEDKPLVYIYNTHPTETFKNTQLSTHSIEPTIKEMAGVLKEKLEELGVNTIVEGGDIPAFLEEHSYNYNQSYTASEYYLQKTYKDNPSIDLFIDLHRDGVDYQYSVTTIDDKKYARVMFVVGLNHDNYQNSLDISSKINNYLKDNYPGITRGIFTNARATYNQHLANNMILIELGGNNNELVEVLNTVDVLALAIKEYIYENR